VGAPVSDVKAGEAPSAESLLESFKTIDAAERRRHASVLNYWLSIRGDKDVAPIRDLDPLEISDAGRDSLLLELIGGGEDAEIKHSGEGLKPHVGAFRLSEATRPSLLSCIAGKLAIVAISRNFLAFEDSYSTKGGSTNCWITLLPFSSTGVWVDYVYAFVTVADAEVPAKADASADAESPADEDADVAAEPLDELTKDPVEGVAETVDPVEAVIEVPLEESVDDEPTAHDLQSDAGAEPDEEDAQDKRPGFSKIFDALTGFHGTSVRAEPRLPVPPIADDEPAVAEEEAPLELDSHFDPATAPEAEAELPSEPEIAVTETPAEPEIVAAEGPLQNKLEEVRAKADEARQAKLRSNIALYEGLGAAYDFALDAEGSPEEYLRLVEAKGLKIQLRSPMTPVVKLAFEGMCDDGMIGQLEAVLAWALKQDLPRGTLAETIEAAGGIGPILNGQAGPQAEAA